MKKVLFFAAVAAAMTSCSDDDNSSPAMSGTYKVTSLTSTNPVDINQDGNATTNLLAETGCYGNSTIVFGTGNKVVLNAEEFSVDLETGDLDCTAQPAQNGTYAVAGNQLTLNVGGEAMVFTKSGNTLTGTDVDTEFGTTTMVMTKQ